MIQTDGLKDGTKWDDIILKFEWLENYQKLYEKYKANDELLSVIKTAKSEMKYCFNDVIFDKWVEIDRTGGYESFSTFAKENIKSF